MAEGSRQAGVLTEITPRSLGGAIPHGALEDAIYEMNLRRDHEIVSVSEFKDSVERLLKALYKTGWRYTRPRAGTRS